MSNPLYVAWRSGDASHGTWTPIGRLDRLKDGYRFLYTRGARKTDFRPLPGMPLLDAVYESQELFPFFANRLLERSRPEYKDFLKWSAFDPDNPPDPLAVLAVTEGRRQTDSYEVFVCPIPDAQGYFNSKFFLHGIRWMPAVAIDRINGMKEGEQLCLMLEVSNPLDPDAVAVRTGEEGDRFLIGYVPRFLAKDVRELCDECGPDLISLTVVRINTDAPLQQRALCCMKACWPSSFRPCSQDEFMPIADDVLDSSCSRG